MPDKHVNPHDRFFRSLMGDPDVARDFFTRHLPQKLKEVMNFAATTVESCSFVDSKLGSQITDMLYKTKFKDETGYIYILVEHQSTDHPLMPFRRLKS